MSKPLVHICSVLLLIAFIVKGFSAILPLLTVTCNPVSKEQPYSEPGTEQETPDENKKMSEQEYVAEHFAGNGVIAVYHITTCKKPHLKSTVLQTFHRSVPTPPPDCI